MNPFRSNVGTLNEILFENKNKMYGAYAIRKAYGNTVFKSLGITSAIILGGIWLLSLLLRKEAEVVVPNTPDLKTLVTYTVDLEQPKKIEKPTVEEHKSATAALKNNAAITQVVIKNNPIDSAKLAVNNNLNPVVTGTASTGTGTTTVASTLTTGASTLTTGGGNSDPTYFPEVSPSFPGGLKNFWSSNLRYPNEARDAGIEGKVAVNFVLDEEGKVTSCKIIKKLGYGCDDEVLRVVKLMPNWNPGKMGGKPVKVTFNQVVDFKLK